MSDTSDKLYDAIVFIGRFEPPHMGHDDVFTTALSRLTSTGKLVILVGSSYQPRTPKNPFTYDERKQMIQKMLQRFPGRIEIRPLRDHPYTDQRWVEEVQRTVQQATPAAQSVALIGHAKDASSYYLQMFPQWDLISHEMNEQISATDLRQLFFSPDLSSRYWKGVVDDSAFAFMEAFKTTSDYQTLLNEYQLLRRYHESWKSAPYAPTFVTVDAVVVCAGHVLLVERGAAPGKGLMALPGGFLDQKEWLIDAMVRELREETRLRVPDPVIRGSVTTTRVYDRPDRSARGRTITHAFLVELPSTASSSTHQTLLPKVKGSDDARDAKWVPIAEIQEQNMFEDHYAILQDLLNRTT